MEKSSLTKSKVKYLLVLLVTCILAFSCAFFTACDKEEQKSEYKPTVNHTDYTSSDDLITNKNFSVGVLSTKKTSFPKSSISGWSVSSDTGSGASSATSGVISVGEEAFTDAVSGAFDNLYSNSTFNTWAEKKYNYSKTDMETAIKNAHTDWDKDQVAKELKKQVIDIFTQNLTNPGKHEGAKDDYVLMINNYSSATSLEKIGLAQAAASSKSVTIEKGGAAKFTVWVATDADLVGSANIRIATTVNGVTQAKYAVKDIKTVGVWKQYTIYVLGNEYANSVVTLSLGLGLADSKTSSNEQFAYGTCYFDDVDAEVYETTAEYEAAIGSETAKNYSKVNETFSGKEDNYRVSALDKTTFFYSLKYNATDFAPASAIAMTSGYIGNETIGKKEGGSGSAVMNASKIEINVVKAAYRVELKKSSGNFSVPANSFVTIKFSLKNELSAYDTNGVGVYVYDVKGDVTEKQSVLTNTTVSEDAVEYTLTVKNTFDYAREFYLAITVGTTTPEKNTADSYFSTGKVTVSDIQIMEGLTSTDDVKNADYDFFNAIVSNYSSVNAMYALHAEYNSNPSDSEDSNSYNIQISLSNKGNIQTEAVNPLDYYGVTSDHKYVKRAASQAEQDSLKTEINTKNTAGAINTEYLTAYGSAYGDLNTALGNAKTDADGEYVQPLMIYNTVADSYGFITKEAVTVSASATTKITVKVRATGLATAYVYLVNMNETSTKLNPITLEAANATKTLMAKVTAETVAKYGENGWVTVTFNVATGATAMKYRLELWNGTRDGQTKSAGYVFFDQIATATFTETTTVNGYKSEGALNEAYTSTINGNELLSEANVLAGIKYTRPLTEAEIEFNKTADEDAIISYDEKYVWVDNADENGVTFIYAIYNSIDPVHSNPVADTDDDTEESSTGCAAQFDSGTFWLQFSTIALAVLLIALILFILIRMIVRKHKKSKKIKSNYNISSRNKTYNSLKKTVEESNDSEETAETEEVEEETSEEPATESEEDNESIEEMNNEVVEDFGDDIFKDAVAEPVNAEEQSEENGTEEVTEEPVETTNDEPSAE